jgi:beta-glucanase (GH16 family)
MKKKFSAGIICLAAAFIIAAARRGGDVFPFPRGRIEVQVTQRPVTSGRVNTYNKFAFKYGRIDAGIKLPKTADGLWPAFWMMGDDYAGGWPECGEIDIMEMGAREGITSGAQDRYLSRGAHWGSPEDGHLSYTIDSDHSASLQDGFHLYTMIWDETKITMYLDPELDSELAIKPGAKPYFEMRIDVYDSPSPVGDYFHKPFFIIFNLAVGGDFPKIYDINQITALNLENMYEARMYIDFVRVFDGRDLIWQDMFDGETPDETKWNIEENDDGGGNHELQSYRRENVSLGPEPETGRRCLVLTARRPRVQNLAVSPRAATAR